LAARGIEYPIREKTIYPLRGNFMTSDSNLQADEIDIRARINTLFRYKWIILGTTLIAMVAVLIYFKFISPRRYLASARVIISKPLYTTNLETSIQGTLPIPEAGVLKDLALDNALLMNVYTTTEEISGTLDKNVSFEQFKTSVNAKLTGTSMVLLGVSMSNPQTSADVVNVWADKFVAQINTLYSLNKISIQVNEEVNGAFNTLDTAENDLKELLKQPEKIVDTLKIKLDNKKSTLTNYLDTITRLDLVMKDAQSLQDRLGVWPGNSRVGMEYQLSLIGLYQRATGGLVGVQIQIAAPATDSLRSVDEAQASLDALRASLDSQRKIFQDNINQLQGEISSASVDYENAAYQYAQLTNKRDLAQNAYQALLAQQREINIDLKLGDVAARVAGIALPPEQPESNRTLVNTLIAGVLTFALSCFGVLFVNWWKAPSPSKQTP